jgi:hypothetical protein
LLTDLFAALKTQTPDALSSVSVTESPGGVDACVRLAHTWRSSREHRDSYVTLANRVEEELGLVQMVWPPEPLEGNETFPCVERTLLAQVKSGLLKTAPAGVAIDCHVEAIDLLSNRVACDAGVALVAAVYSALKRQSVQAGLVIRGDLSIQGNIKAVRSLAEPLQVAMDNGARRALVPLENKRSFLEVSGEIVERVDPVFFSDPMTAAVKALGMT